MYVTDIVTLDNTAASTTTSGSINTTVPCVQEQLEHLEHLLIAIQEHLTVGGYVGAYVDCA